MSPKRNDAFLRRSGFDNNHPLACKRWERRLTQGTVKVYKSCFYCTVLLFVLTCVLTQAVTLNQKRTQVPAFVCAPLTRHCFLSTRHFQEVKIFNYGGRRIRRSGLPPLPVGTLTCDRQTDNTLVLRLAKHFQTDTDRARGGAAHARAPTPHGPTEILIVYIFSQIPDNVSLELQNNNVRMNLLGQESVKQLSSRWFYIPVQCLLFFFVSPLLRSLLLPT